MRLWNPWEMRTLSWASWRQWGPVEARGRRTLGNHFLGGPWLCLSHWSLGEEGTSHKGAAPCLRLSVCCIFWNPGWDSASENHKTLHEKTRCAQELSTPLETAMSTSFCGSRDWSAQNSLEREWPSPTGQSPPARGFCKGAFFPSTGLKGLEFKLYCDMGEWN